MPTHLRVRIQLSEQAGSLPSLRDRCNEWMIAVEDALLSVRLIGLQSFPQEQEAYAGAWQVTGAIQYAYDWAWRFNAA